MRAKLLASPGEQDTVITREMIENAVKVLEANNVRPVGGQYTIQMHPRQFSDWVKFRMSSNTASKWRAEEVRQGRYNDGPRHHRKHD